MLRNFRAKRRLCRRQACHIDNILDNSFLCIAEFCAGNVEIRGVIKVNNTIYIQPRILTDRGCQSLNYRTHRALCIVLCALLTVSRIDKKAVMREYIFPFAPLVENNYVVRAYNQGERVFGISLAQRTKRMGGVTRTG